MSDGVGRALHAFRDHLYRELSDPSEKNNFAVVGTQGFQRTLEPVKPLLSPNTSAGGIVMARDVMVKGYGGAALLSAHQFKYNPARDRVEPTEETFGLKALEKARGA